MSSSSREPAAEPLPTPTSKWKEAKWKLAANAQYQEAMKILINLATASLVLPIFFVKNFVSLKPDQTLAGYLGPYAYWAWGLLFLSLLFGMMFYWASAKFVKVIRGGVEEVPCGSFVKIFYGGELPSSEKWFENLRGGFIVGSIACFFVGLVLLLLFFRSLLI